MKSSPMNLRSKDFGSPNARKRCYMIGARVDVCNETIFEKMCEWIEHKCPSIHTRMSLDDCALFALHCN